MVDQDLKIYVKDNHGMAFGLLYFTVVIFDLVNDGHNLEIINRNLEYVRNLEYMIKLIIKENEKWNRWIGDNIVSSFKAIQKVIRNQFVFQFHGLLTITIFFKEKTTLF